MITIVINGKKISTQEGRTILEVAREAGIEIPTLCNHESLPPYAACRFCIVEVAYKGVTRYRASCIFPVAEGMEIKTHSERGAEDPPHAGGVDARPVARSPT